MDLKNPILLFFFICWLKCSYGQTALPISLQMHIHGHSHHNGALKPGSMQWHSWYANNKNLDVLWWTDHNQIFDQSVPFLIPFDTAQIDTSLTITHLNNFGNSKPGDDLVLKSSISGGTGTASIEGSRLFFGLTSDSSAITPQAFFYYPKTVTGAISNFLLARPLTSNVFLEFSLERSQMINSYFEVIVVLSWHNETSSNVLQKIIYTFSDQETGEKVLSDSSTLNVSVITPSQSEANIKLNITENALLLTNGMDNAITEVKFAIKSKLGEKGTVYLGPIKLSSNITGAQNQLTSIDSLAQKYESQYGLKENIGVEYSQEVPGKPTVHLNGFVPRSGYKTYLYYRDSASNEDPSIFTARVRNEGGISSYNHLFFDKPIGQQHLFPQLIQDQKSNLKAQQLINEKAFGTDILEVGYLYRGGLDLRHHLLTWDKLTANQLYLYGNGVSDSHGNEWTEAKLPNPFVTWVWASTSEIDSLIKYIKNGRMFFGNSFKFNGALDFSVGQYKMGYRGLTSEGSGKLKIIYQAFPTNTIFYLKQGLIAPGLAVTYIRDEIINPQVEISVDLLKPCFIRIEAYLQDSTPLVFSNPIVFTGLEPKVLNINSSITKMNFSCDSLEYGAIDLSISNGYEPYNILWNNGDTTANIDGLIAGTYTYKVADAGGNYSEDSILIEIGDSIPHIINYYPEVITDSSAIINWKPVNGALGYLIKYSGPEIIDSVIINDTSFYLNGLTGSTTYTYKIKVICDLSMPNQYNYGNERSLTTLPPGLGVSDSNAPSNSIKIYPNPGTGTFFIKGLSRGSTLKLFDLTGKEINYYNYTVTGTKSKVSISRKGVFILKVSHPGGRTENHLIIIL